MVLFVLKSVFQAILLAVFYYWVYTVLSGNQANQVMRAVLIYAAVSLVSGFLELTVLDYMLKTLWLPFVMLLFVLFQPEIRRALAPGFSRRSSLFRTTKTSNEDIDKVIEACRQLAQVKRGALIVFPRHVSIRNIIDTGTRLDAEISTALIVTVFDHDTPLHDGAVIIQGNRIVAAGCYLPLSSQTGIKQSFGTRHRAALGMAEESDAAVIIVSEETKAISLAYGGTLYYQLGEAELKNALMSLFNNLDFTIRNEKGI